MFSWSFGYREPDFKLGDLNVSKISKSGLASTQAGTPYYASPEVWSDLPYTSKCDVSVRPPKMLKFQVHL